MTDVVTVLPPVAPMLAKAVGAEVPPPDAVPGGLLYEPKWDGFRAIIFRSVDGSMIQSRSQQDLSYCFPEMVAAADELPVGTVLDGELVVVQDQRLDFDALSSRLRPRKEAGGANIADLSNRYPTRFVAFDILAVPGTDLRDTPLAERRRVLTALSSSLPSGITITPASTHHQTAQEWFGRFEGAGLDGLVAKPLTGTYRPGKRDLWKVKHQRTADVVVAGWRAHQHPGPAGEPVVGSLLLGLHDHLGRLQHVGSASGFAADRRVELLSEISSSALSDEEIADHPWATPTAGVRAPGGPSRWRANGGTDVHLLRPELVLEVRYDAMEGDRFRHVARFDRWRADRTADSCSFDQLQRPASVPVDELFDLR